MAFCPELDIAAEAASKDAVLADIASMAWEYAQVFDAERERFRRAPSRAGHEQYVDEVLECGDERRVIHLFL